MQREQLVAKMAYQAERGGANARSAIKAMREQLDELTLLCEDQSGKLASLERQLEKEVGSLEYMNSEETSTLFKVMHAVAQARIIIDACVHHNKLRSSVVFLI